MSNLLNKYPLRVLVACEESQAIATSFRELGHEAYSCDIQECSGNHPEYHILGDVLPILNGRTDFKTQDGVSHRINTSWDLIIAHPPCTDLAVSGFTWYYTPMKDGSTKTQEDLDKASEFFMRMVNADCPHIAVENPVCFMSSLYRKPDQVIQPYMFGHPETKATCLWLKGLPPLFYTNFVYKRMRTLPEKEQHRIHYLGGYAERSKLRSKTYSGIAHAIATQWSNSLTHIHTYTHTPISVLSLFDGISTGQLALERAHIPYSVYYSSEIAPSAIQVTQSRYPNTVQLGNALEIDFTPYRGKIDLLIAGSPNNSSSVITARKCKDKDTSPLSEFFRAIEEIQPKYFLLESVYSIPDEDRDYISNKLGVPYIEINSSKFSAQNRRRYYWCNFISDSKQFIDTLPNNQSVLQDILEDNIPSKYYYKQSFTPTNNNNSVVAYLNVNTTEMCKRISNKERKCPTLTGVSGGYQHKKILEGDKARRLTPVEYERLQTFPDNYTKVDGVNDLDRYSLVGNSWTVDVITHILKELKQYVIG